MQYKGDQKQAEDGKISKNQQQKNKKFKKKKREMPQQETNPQQPSESGIQKLDEEDEIENRQSNQIQKRRYL